MAPQTNIINMNKSLSLIKEEAITFPKGMLTQSTQNKFDQQIGHSVVNLTDTKFTQTELELLNKGLSFSPSPTKHSLSTLWLDYKKFERSLILKQFFHNSPEKPMDPLYKFKEKSTWRP